MPESRGIRVRRGTRIAWAKAEQGKHFCECGCGAVVKVRPEHFNLGGVPKFVHGHNGRLSETVKAARIGPVCACGCGARANYGKRYVSGHNLKGRPVSEETRRKIADAHRGEKSHLYGKRSTTWKGGIRMDQGYVTRWAPLHPFASCHYVREHRLVMEEHLRRTDPESEWLVEVDGQKYLRRYVHVHHIDHDKLRNVVANLEVITPSEHSKLHRPKGSPYLGRRRGSPPSR